MIGADPFISSSLRVGFNFIIMQRELSRSVEMGPHFQKDIIIPNIYNLENIKLIQSCNYP